MSGVWLRAILVAIYAGLGTRATAQRAEAVAPRGPVTDVVLLERDARLEVHARGVDRVDAASARRVFARRPDRTIAAARVGTRFVLVGGEPSKKGNVTLHKNTGEQLARVVVTKDLVHRVVASPDRERFVIADADGRVISMRVLAKAPYLRTEREVCRHAGGAHALAFSPDGRWLASGGQDGLVLVSELVTSGDAKARQRVLDDHRGPVLAVAYAPDGDEIASSSTDGAVRIHAASGRLLRSWLSLGRDLRAVCWVGGRDAVLVACGDGRLRLCDREAEGVRTIGKPGRALFSLALRGPRALAGTWNGVRVFDIPRR